MRPRTAVVIVLGLGLMLWFAGGGEAVAGKAKPKGKGTVVVRADVEKAVVYQGKKKLGTTPLTVKLKPGKVTLTVKKAGQDDATVEVVVVAGQQVEAFARVTTVPALRTQALRSRCDAGDLDGCHELADELGEARASPLVDELLRPACDRGNQGACAHLADVTWGAGDATQTAEAESLLRAACDAGDVGGCKNLGITLLFVEESKRNPRRGVQLLQGACDAGDGMSCDVLARAYVEGQAGVTDDARAAALIARACELDYAFGCYSLAAWTAEGAGGLTKDEVAASELYQRACDGGVDEACGALGLRYVKGKGVPVSEQRARPLLERGCRASDEEACAQYGVIVLAARRTISADGTPITEVLRASCERGGLNSCILLGNHFHDKGGDASEAEAQRWWMRACDGGRADACDHVEKDKK